MAQKSLENRPNEFPMPDKLDSMPQKARFSYGLMQIHWLGKTGFMDIGSHLKMKKYLPKAH